MLVMDCFRSTINSFHASKFDEYIFILASVLEDCLQNIRLPRYRTLAKNVFSGKIGRFILVIIVFGFSANPKAVEFPLTETHTVYHQLNMHFDKKIAAGLLSQERADEVLAMYDDQAVRAVFTDKFGALNIHLMVSTLATAGTVLDGAIEVFLGDNKTGKPAKVFYGEPSKTHFDAEVYITSSRQMYVIANQNLKFVPFQIVATLMGHEAFHQDIFVTQNEEVIAGAAQYVAYAQQLLVNPQLATNNVPSAQVNNSWLLTLMNSGKAGFPNPGLEEAPLVRLNQESSLANWSRVPFRSFKHGRIQVFYSNTPTGNSPGNVFLSKVAGKISGGKKFSRIEFNDQSLKVFDNVRALSAEQWGQVAATLKLSYNRDVQFASDFDPKAATSLPL